jgi:putative membrane protein
VLYLWIKALHVISIIAWMAALLYLPRLMVYHTQAEIGSTQSETFKTMERRLLKAIANPAMIASWVFGLWIAFTGNWWSSPWFHAKLLAVVGLTAMHMWMARWVRQFANDANQRSERFYRAMNEVPTVLMIAAVVFVIVKPF